MRRAGEECRVSREIGERRVPSAIRNRDPRIEVTTIRLLDDAATRIAIDRVVVRPIGGEIVRRRTEVTMREIERREDVLLDVRLPGVAAQLLDDTREIDESGIRVRVTRTRPEVQLLIWHHRDELIPRRRLERLPRLTVRVRPGRVLKAGRVRHQHAQRNAVDHAVRIVHLSELGHVTSDRLIEREAATIVQLHDRDRRERLGDRAPVEDRACVDALLRRSIGPAVIVAVDDATVAHDEHAGAYDTVAVGVGIEQSEKAAPIVRGTRCCAA